LTEVIDNSSAVLVGVFIDHSSAVLVREIYHSSAVLVGVFLSAEATGVDDETAERG
jgi:hypothetical protein